MSSSSLRHSSTLFKRLSYAKDFLVIIILGWSTIRTLYSSTTQSVAAVYDATLEQHQHHDPSFFLPLQQQPTKRIDWSWIATSTNTSTTTNTKEQDVTLPLHVLVDTHRHIVCPDPLIRMDDRILPSAPAVFQDQPPPPALVAAISGVRKIPKIIHMTSKSRCLTPGFVTNVQTWQFPDHSFYFHDDQAVERLLLGKAWLDFPHIPLALKCLRSGAAKADLWRYLILWEYGGIYTDLDNTPGKDFFVPHVQSRDVNSGNITTTSTATNVDASSSSSSLSSSFYKPIVIQDDDDAFFVVEQLGVLSQYFMAASPHHPLLYLAVQTTLLRLLEVPHVGAQYIPQVTGPGALKMAFKYFMRTPDTDKNGRVRQGIYVGVGNRTVTVLGHKDTGSHNYIQRATMVGKAGQYKQMNMKHYSLIAKKKFNESCLVHAYHLDHFPMDLNLTNW
jgi:hypothetical protein